MKFGDTHSQRKADGVAPFAGAWIEIVHLYGWSPDHPVAPFAGAWIEIIGHLSIFRAKMSLPSRERGLKYPVFNPLNQVLRRFLRGSVD